MNTYYIVGECGKFRECGKLGGWGGGEIEYRAINTYHITGFYVQLTGFDITTEYLLTIIFIYSVTIYKMNLLDEFGISK